MAFELHRGEGLPVFAASPINPKTFVRWDTSDRKVLPLATNSQEPLGAVHATALTGEGLAVHETKSIVKAVAAASLGAGADLMVASTNGALGPAAAGASGVVRWRVGVSQEAAAAGETFSVYVNPRQISGFPI